MRRISLAFSVIVLVVAYLPPAVHADSPSRLFEARDLFDLQQVSDPQISPDGRVVAYVRVSFGIMTDRPVYSIWLVDTKSGAQQPLDTGSWSARSPRWSPDGMRLAYIVERAGHAQLYERWIKSGQSARLTDVTGDPKDPQWSRDGRWIAFVMRTSEGKRTLGVGALTKPAGAEWPKPPRIITDVTYRKDSVGYLGPGHSYIFVVPAEGGFARRLTFGPFDDHGPIVWTHDGHSILFSGNRSGNWQRDGLTSQIYEVSVSDGKVTQLTHRVGPDKDPRVSPDGQKIAYLGFDDRLLGHQNFQVYIMDRNGGDDHSITASLDRSIDNLQWAADGRSLFVQYTDRAITKVARLKLDGSIKTVVTGLEGSQIDRPYTLGAAFSASSNGTVAVTSGSSDAPADLSIVRNSRITRLTRLNENLLAHIKLATTRHLTVRSSYDNRRIDAWLVTPPDFDSRRKYPVILEIHGGPYGCYGPYFSSDDQLYAAAGYMVVYANPRGSISYGETFANLIQHAYPGHDYDDLMSAVNAVIATGSVNPDELFVTGGSGGGILSAWIVGKTHRFRAAAIEKPVINYVSWVLTTDQAVSVIPHWFGKMPWQDPQEYWRHSPLSLVGNVNTPSLLIVGSQDYRTPVSESEQYYEALRLRGVPTELVEVPGASHLTLTARPSQSAVEVNAILAWFGRYRGASPKSRHANGARPRSLSQLSDLSVQ